MTTCGICGLVFGSDEKTVEYEVRHGIKGLRHKTPDCPTVARARGGDELRKAAVRLADGEIGVLYDHDFDVSRLLLEAFPEFFADEP